MAMEYKLPITASELKEKILSIDKKVELIDGKIPISQIPDDIVDLSNYYTKTEIDNIIGDCDAVINSINILIGGEDV